MHREIATTEAVAESAHETAARPAQGRTTEPTSFRTLRADEERALARYERTDAPQDRWRWVLARRERARREAAERAEVLSAIERARRTLNALERDVRGSADSDRRRA